MIINAGIDAGYSTYQGLSKLAEVKFDAYIQEVDELDFKDIRTKVNSVDENNLLIKFEDKYYVIGRLAVKHYPTIIKKISVVRDEKEIKAMYATCLGLLCENKSFDVNLAVGTPNRSREDKAHLETILKGKYDITYFTKDDEIKKSIKVVDIFAMSQPMACCFILDEETRENSNMIVLDIGHGTADTMYIESGLHISNVAGMRYNTRGMEKVYKMMRDALLKSDICKKVNMTIIPERTLQMIVETGKFFISGKEQDITSIYEDCLYNYANSFFADVESNYYEVLQIADIVLASGGVFCNTSFTKYVAEKFKTSYNVKFITDGENPQMAVVRGLYNFTNEYFEDDYTTSQEVVGE